MVQKVSFRCVLRVLSCTHKGLVLRMPNLHRKIVETVFSTPPHSSFEEALQYFLLAEEAEPGFWNKNVLMIAKSYAKMGTSC